MTDLQTLGFIAVAVAIVAATLYVLDRKNRGSPIDWLDMGKLSVGAAAVTSGVVYAVGSDAITDVVETVTTGAQEMFVGKASF
jgi:hypothetical protein